jgi:hypothetical protein
MVIFVPPGAKRDRTRTPDLYDGVYEYLRRIGVEPVREATDPQPAHQR